MSSESPITVLVVDDQDLVRSGFKAILSTYDGIEIVGTARNGVEAVQEAQRLKPDVVLMDIRMPEMSGIEATRAITGNPLLVKTRVLVLTTFDIDEYVYDALGAGASGFLLKDADPDEIVAAIRVVADGDALIQPKVMRRLVETFVAARPRAGWGSADAADGRRAALATLTDREREILILVARGLSNDEIAEDLFISPATVKTHLARIMAKTDAHDRAQLVVFAYETGLVSPAR
ncbi:MAG: response regulator transcription factor [Adlercreutzia sp.]|nr:response regulator transcription factor [Adlercreutzia sp.]